MEVTVLKPGMSTTHQKILQLVKNDQILVSEHGYNELADDDILLKDILTSISSSIVIEDYPDYFKGPCILLLQHDCNNRPIHVVWGIPLGKQSPAVIVTAYRPDPDRWNANFKQRKK